MYKFLTILFLSFSVYCSSNCEAYFKNLAGDWLSNGDIMELYNASLKDPYHKESEFFPDDKSSSFSKFMITYMYATKMGLTKDDIHTVWVSGVTKENNPVYKAAVFVRNRYGVSIVIDPEIGHPMELNEWLVSVTENLSKEFETFVGAN